MHVIEAMCVIKTIRVMEVVEVVEVMEAVRAPPMVAAQSPPQYQPQSSG